MHETLHYLNELKLHKKDFQGIKSELDLCYQDYSNKGTIINLLQFWIFSIRALHLVYDAKIVKMYLKGDRKDIFNFSAYHEFGSPLYDIKKKEIRNKLSWFFNLNIYSSREYSLPGAPNDSLLKKIRSKYTMHLLSKIQLSFNEYTYNTVISIINSYFRTAKLNIDLKDLSIGLPDLFKSDQVDHGSDGIAVLKCVPFELLQFLGHENLLLLNQKIIIQGYQHGGGYEIFNGDTLTEFEKMISNKFFGWGLSKNNVRQKKYKRKNSFLSRLFKNKKIVWIESPKDSKISSVWYPLQAYVQSDQAKVDYVYNELKDFGGQFFRKQYPGVLKSNMYDGIKSDIITGSPEEFLMRGDLVIFDNSLHSLIFHCIEQKILFIIISNRNVYNYYMPKAKEWIDLLRENDLFFFSDENKKLSTKLKSLDFNFTIPDEVIMYHQNIFINVNN